MDKSSYIDESDDDATENLEFECKNDDIGRKLSIAWMLAMKLKSSSQVVMKTQVMARRTFL